MTTPTPEAIRDLGPESAEHDNPHTELYKLAGAYAVGGLLSSPLDSTDKMDINGRIPLRRSGRVITITSVDINVGTYY